MSSTPTEPHVRRNKLQAIVHLPSRLLRSGSRRTSRQSGAPSVDAHSIDSTSSHTHAPHASVQMNGTPVHTGPTALDPSAGLPSSQGLPDSIASLSPSSRTTGIPAIDEALLLPSSWSSPAGANELMSLAEAARNEQRARREHAEMVLHRIQLQGEVWRQEVESASEGLNRAVLGLGAVAAVRSAAIGPHDPEIELQQLRAARLGASSDREFLVLTAHWHWQRWPFSPLLKAIGTVTASFIDTPRNGISHTERKTFDDRIGIAHAGPELSVQNLELSIHHFDAFLTHPPEHIQVPNSNRRSSLRPNAARRRWLDGHTPLWWIKRRTTEKVDGRVSCRMDPFAA
ncbi:hypothetical protein BV25DRAFT_1911961 [Artomyces pyxidatus]|uniref:Uncharacterized protein n=1 Tax=Artomyces pyxidatus TaxID=48021 RepID=A0ACB8TFW0_9AGAM|nr:hypothetical protein BV25DRAFT_1911961 [Artomyces pyxidatus]